LDIPVFFKTVWENAQDMRWQEAASTVAQIASVWYARKNNLLVYPTGIVGVLLAAWIYFFLSTPPVYADGAVNVYYFIMSVYGWYNWAQKKDAQHEAYPISWCNKKEMRTGLFLFLVAWAALFVSLQKLTNSNTPLLDSLTSASAITAMWWMAKRKIENWLAWIFSNIVALPLNFYKGFYLFTLMYVLFLVLAWMGYREWAKKLKHGTV
jgi:nicotinamide mononucleotide transporter